MPAIRVRKPFAASFVLLLLAAAYLGLSDPKLPQYGQSDKGLHFLTFFLLTLTFYWIIETSRRRVVHFTLLICTGALSIGSEILQALLPNGRAFDPFDILANVVGSALALGLSSWYHKRMLERRRKNKHYDIVPGEEPGEDEDVGGDGQRDVELGVVGSGEQETGSVSVPVEANGQAEAGAAQSKATPDVSEALDNWDENAEDWDDGEGDLGDVSGGVADTEGGDVKMRAD
ncbi:hypothetical protein B0A55_10012 [Friedmanniomyces simplex]|uniref:VanZ-like domain-containing protein n=1 Tax=Friedmanniomyces simplex TaxID=329884 RepID=A0A4U0WNM1_9PEZI|nr:hypothetical protein B0A55_10012 [Friedmanniomyces simplex]